MNQYQLYIKHIKEACPLLPEPFQYQDQTYDPFRCPYHSVLTFRLGTRIVEVRKQIGELKRVQGIVSITLYQGEMQRESDCWELVNGRWERI